LNDILVFLIIMLCNGFSECKGQKEFGTNLLQADKQIPLPGIKGRIDHMDINLKDQVVYIAALGNNSVEAVDLRNNKIIHSIKGLDEPQGVGYIPQNNEILIANGGDGDCYFYNAHSFEKVATIHLSSDADDVRYDSAERKIYVGYGEGGIAIIDADTHKLVADIKLPAHPESFQVDPKLKLLFVNIPNADMIGVIDLNQQKLIHQWVTHNAKSNFPMTIDTNKHRIIVGYRHPAKLIVYDSETGKEISVSDMVGDSDDLYYDDESANIFISGGAGYINIYHLQESANCNQIANIATYTGARTSLFVPQLKLFLLAARAAPGRDAALWVYKVSH